jgi:Na+-translocating ferredoxin:NAD+ oxidoreductase RNF subunit RnfB
VLIATSVIAGLGLVAGVGLSLAARFFAVETDPRQEQVLDALPGANCGGCGYAGCADFAAAVVKGVAPVDGCPVGGAECAGNVAGIMGLSVETKTRRVAFVHCQGTEASAPRKFLYNGMASCTDLNMLGGGDLPCAWGCLGLGDCQDACAFQAIEITDGGVARVISDRCTACGKCVTACPRQIIDMVPETARIHVLCSNQDKGGVARKACEHACIGCKKCEKFFTDGGMVVKNFLARVDYDKAPDDPAVINECPAGSIKYIELDKPETKH